MHRPTEAALLAALRQGCTTKTKALAQAHHDLRASGGWVPRAEVEWAWQRLEREGHIVREDRAWRVVEVADET